MDKKQALFDMWKQNGWNGTLEEIETTDWDSDVLIVESEEWLVLTDEEADEKCTEYVRENIWTFNPNFLAGYLPVGMDAEILNTMQAKLCEDANPAILAMVGDGFENLVEHATGADGRGHYLAGYDGVEIEEGGYYLYRLN